MKNILNSTPLPTPENMKHVYQTISPSTLSNVRESFEEMVKPCIQEENIYKCEYKEEVIAPLQKKTEYFCRIIQILEVQND